MRTGKKAYGGEVYEDVEASSATIVHMTWVCTSTSLIDIGQHEIVVFSVWHAVRM